MCVCVCMEIFKGVRCVLSRHMMLRQVNVYSFSQRGYYITFQRSICFTYSQVNCFSLEFPKNEYF